MGDTSHNKTLWTYIVTTNSFEYYCGKTYDVEKRMIQHLKEKKTALVCIQRQKKDFFNRNSSWRLRKENKVFWNKAIFKLYL